MAKSNGDEHVLDTIIQLNREVLAGAGLQPEVAERLAVDLCRRLVHEFGGDEFYVPVGRLWRLDERYEKIFDEFNGSNQRALATKHGLSVRWVEVIIRQVRERRFQQRQGNLVKD
jgi:Mor family transcriptional regulator